MSANNQGITPSDVSDVAAIFQDLSPPIDPANIAFVFNEEGDRWDAYDKTDMTACVACGMITGWTPA